MDQEKHINLKNRVIDTHKINDWVSITTHTLSDSNLDELASIAKMLDKVGVSLEVTRNENSSAGLAYDFIILKVNKEKYNKVLTRQAGRKADFTEKYDKYGKCTVAELQEKLSCMTKTNIAKELGCSRMTLYRILKNIEVLSPDESTSIWHYTS